MKKIMFFAVALAAVSLASCGNGNKEANADTTSVVADTEVAVVETPTDTVVAATDSVVAAPAAEVAPADSAK